MSQKVYVVKPSPAVEVTVSHLGLSGYKSTSGDHHTYTFYSAQQIKDPSDGPSHYRGLRGQERKLVHEMESMAFTRELVSENTRYINILAAVRSLHDAPLQHFIEYVVHVSVHGRAPMNVLNQN